LSSPHTVDALIVGAGPAGATAGYVLAREGLKVLILDKARFPRQKICGGLVTWKTLRVLEEIFGISPQTLRSQGILFHSTREYTLRNRRRLLFAEHQRDPFYFVDRGRYDQFWLDKAIAAGADAVQGDRVTGVDPDAGMVHTRGGKTYRGKALIGADGVLSRVKASVMKHAAGGRRHYHGMAAAMVAHVPDREDMAVPGLSFGYVPWGYAWSFPGPGYRNYGMLTLKTRGAKNLRAAFHEFLKSRSGADIRRASIYSRLLPYGCFTDVAGSKCTLLAGDACGLADPFLGEGIFYAHRSGQLAAEAILSTHRVGWSPLNQYRHLLRRSIIYELQFASAWQHILYRLLRLGDYRLLAISMRYFHRPIEDVVQGRRSFNWRHRHNLAFYQMAARCLF